MSAITDKTAKLEQELGELHAKYDMLAGFTEMACGHSSDAAYSPDGQGFSIKCHICEKEELRAIVEALSKDNEFAAVQMARAEKAKSKLKEAQEQEPACEVAWRICNSLYEVRTLCYDLPIGSKLYAAPIPTAAVQDVPEGIVGWVIEPPDGHKTMFWQQNEPQAVPEVEAVMNAVREFGGAKTNKEILAMIQAAPVTGKEGT